jgi:PAS domain S-box-containing protein
MKRQNDKKTKIDKLKSSQTSHARTAAQRAKGPKKPKPLPGPGVDFRLIADNTADFEFLADPKGRFIYASPSCLAVTGYSPEDFLAAPGLFKSILHPEDMPAYDRHRREVKKHIAGRVVWRLTKKDGSARWISHVCKPVFSQAGKYLGERGSNRDITDRMRMEETLRESEQRFAKIFQNNAAAITLVRLRDGTILDVNKKWHEVFGFSRREVIGKNSTTGIRIWKDQEQRRRFYKELATQKPVQNFECQLLRKNGEEWTALISSEVIQLQGEPVGIGFLQDITALKRAEAENRSLAKFPSENPNPVMRFTPQGDILYANAAASSLLEPGKRARGISAPKALLRTIGQACAARSPMTIDLEIRQRIYTFDVLPLVEAGYINVYGRDETEHRQDEAALRVSEGRYRSLFDKMAEGFALHEIICNKKGVPVDYRFLEINPAFEELTGLKRGAVIGQMFSKLLPGEDPRWLRIFGEVALTGKPAKFENYSSVLKKHYSVVAFSPAPRQFAVLFTDISEERKKQAELRKLNRTLKALSDSSKAMMQATNEEEFLAETCQIIVSDCGHKMAWISYKENDKEKSVRPVAHAGFEKGYLETLRLTWANTERGRGPTGTAIRTGKPVICRNILRDPRFAPWREDARKRGYFSSIALPLLANGRAFGAIAIYSEDLDPFSPAEVELLRELAERLAFGIQALRLRREHGKAEQALQETSNYLEKLLNYANAPIVVWDPGFRIMRFNHAFERLTGYDAAQVLGKPLDMLFPAASRKRSLKLIRDTLGGKQWEIVEIPILQKGGAIRTVLWNSANILAKDGAVVATIAQGQDITERKKTEELLQNSLEVLRIAQRAAKAGMWSWDIVSDKLTWSEEFFQLFGIDPARGASFANWMAALHPDDRKPAMAQISRAIEKHLLLLNEYRIVLPGGEQRWIRAAGNTSYDKAGKPLRMAGICIDSTEHKLAEKQVEDSLHEKEMLLRELYHRTKNNMNIISSLVALQASEVHDLNVQRMFADMQSRIRTMSLVHEKLYQSHDLSNLDMSEYLGDLAQTILAGYKNSAARIVLDLDIESVAFPIDAAIPCGLVINELMTNSLKYAFPEEMSGRIGISLNMSPGEEATLCYKDNGIGFPSGFDPMKATSLGLKVVHNLVRKQLLGTLKFIAVQGMRAVITFKKPVSPDGNRREQAQ